MIKVSRFRNSLFEQAKKAIPSIKSFWKSYGYYVSLVCLMALFGTAAYLYRTSDNETVIDLSPDVRGQSVLAPVESSENNQNIPTSVYFRPEFVLPTDGEVVNLYYPDSLKWNETLKQWRAHGGIDISAPTGTAVAAAESGTISAVYLDDLYGYTVEIAHGSGYTTRYSSLISPELAEVGRSVEKGDFIGAVGASAMAETYLPPHLHFELLKDGEYIEPFFSIQ